MKAMSVIGLTLLAALTAFFLYVIWVWKTDTSVPELDLSQASSREAKVELIDKWLEQAHAEHKFNGIVLMIRGGDVLIEKGYGYTDYTRSTALTAASSLRLASVSKQFTAAGIMALHDQGKLTLDDPVSRHIKSFPYDDVTIRHLLNNTSGVPNNYMELAEKHIKEPEFLTQEKAVQLIIDAAAPAQAAPGAEYEYSNTNYVLLARIAELVSGQSFETFMQKTIFIPMGMTNTRVWNRASADTTFNGKTEGFDFYKPSKVTPITLSLVDGVSGDGAVFSSINDFKIWNEFWTKNSIISQDTLTQAFVTPTLADGSISDYGFGWILTDNGHWHNGQWLAANSIFIRNPKNDSVLFVVDNSWRISFDNIVGTLATALHGMD